MVQIGLYFLETVFNRNWLSVYEVLTSTKYYDNLSAGGYMYLSVYMCIYGSHIAINIHSSPTLTGNIGRGCVES